MEDYGIFEGLFTEIAAPLINGTLGKMAHGAKAAWGKVEDHKAAKAYKAKLEKRYGTIQILGQPEPQKLGKVYTDVYLHDRPTHSYSMGIEQLEESFKKRGRFGRDERIDGLEFAKQQDRLFILGKPGAGKTTFMKYLTIQAADGNIPKIPVFVSLNDLVNKKISILEYIAAQFDVCNFPNKESFIEQLLNAGNGLILFDGLDEVRKEGENVTYLIQNLKGFIDKYEKNQIIISCRIATSEYSFSDFHYVEIADFDEKQIESFVSGWFAEDKRKSESFLVELENFANHGIKEMAMSPLLLTMLCIQFESSMTISLSRSEIFDEATYFLLKAWDIKKPIKRDKIIVEEGQDRILTTKRKKQLLSYLAYQSFSHGELFLKQSWLEDQIAEFIGAIPTYPHKDEIDGATILKQIESQHGFLVERATRVYSFSHFSLQEYFTACYISEHLSASISKRFITEAQLIDEEWKEVFLFVSELLPSGDEFIKWVAESLQQLASKSDLKSLVKWVEKRSNERPLAKRSATSKAGYLSLIPVSTKSDDFMASATIFMHILSRVSVFEHAGDLAIAVLNARSCSSVTQRDGKLNTTQEFGKVLNLVLEHAASQELEFAMDRVFSSDLNFSAQMQFALEACENLSWEELSIALHKIPMPTQDLSRETWQQLDRVINEIILANWKWEVSTFDEVANFTMWMEGSNLLHDCLNRTRLIKIDREEFENEMLYCLPKGKPIQLMGIN